MGVFLDLLGATGVVGLGLFFDVVWAVGFAGVVICSWRVPGYVLEY